MTTLTPAEAAALSRIREGWVVVPRVYLENVRTLLLHNENHAYAAIAAVATDLLAATPAAALAAAALRALAQEAPGDG